MATGNNWEFEEDEGEANEEQAKQQSKGGGLRAHAEQVKRENDELKDEIAKFRATERERNLKEAIKAKGFDPGIVGLVPKEISSEDDVTKWLNDNAKLFKSASQEEEEVVQQESEEDELADDVQAWGRVSRVSSSALPPSKQADTMAAIRNAKTREELNEVLRGFGNTNF